MTAGAMRERLLARIDQEIAALEAQPPGELDVDRVEIVAKLIVATQRLAPPAGPPA